MRTNEEFDSCRVRKGRDDIVSISDRDRGQQVTVRLDPLCQQHLGKMVIILILEREKVIGNF